MKLLQALIELFSKATHDDCISCNSMKPIAEMKPFKLGGHQCRDCAFAKEMVK